MCTTLKVTCYKYCQFVIMDHNIIFIYIYINIWNRRQRKLNEKSFRNPYLGFVLYRWFENVDFKREEKKKLSMTIFLTIRNNFIIANILCTVKTLPRARACDYEIVSTREHYSIETYSFSPFKHISRIINYYTLRLAVRNYMRSFCSQKTFFFSNIM